MGLWQQWRESEQREEELRQLKKRNEIEAEKLRVMQQEKQSGKEKLKYCPHCGKPLP